MIPCASVALIPLRSLKQLSRLFLRITISHLQMEQLGMGGGEGGGGQHFHKVPKIAACGKV